MKYADLHLHTCFSDSTYTPAELVEKAFKCGLSCIAVVDHDTFDGIGPTRAVADEKGIEVISGIELTCEHLGIEVHILGYLIDYRYRPLIEKLTFLKKYRIERIYKIIEKLKLLGLDLSPQSVFGLAGGGTIGRLHVARAMEKEGLVSNIFEAFHKYIGDRKPAYVAGFQLSIPEAVALIKNSGGVPVLAHPYSLNNDDLVVEFINYGVMGLEVYYPEHTQSMVNYYRKMADKYQLLCTGGSDCHGAAKPSIRIGSIKLPYELVEKLKQAKEHL